MEDRRVRPRWEVEAVCSYHKRTLAFFLITLLCAYVVFGVDAMAYAAPLYAVVLCLVNLYDNVAYPLFIAAERSPVKDEWVWAMLGLFAVAFIIYMQTHRPCSRLCPLK